MLLEHGQQEWNLADFTAILNEFLSILQSYYRLDDERWFQVRQPEESLDQVSLL
jgi:hypothetical protein